MESVDEVAVAGVSRASPTENPVVVFSGAGEM